MRRSFSLLLSALALLGGCEGCDGSTVTELTPLITPSADRVDFGPVFIGASLERSLELRSSGTAPVDVGALRLTGSAGFALEAGGPGLLAPGATQLVSLRFTPIGAGPFAGELLVESDATNDPTLLISLSALALEPLECPNENPCLESVFDPDVGQCLYLPVEGECDDGSGCTTDDVCVDGQCLGAAIDCPAEDQCSIGVCAAEGGCFSVPDPDACADDNPCTEDLCDPVTGCSHPSVEDGTPCGASFGCQAAPLCFLGECVEFAAPDGTPCNDGDLCTIEDQCVAGACGGERVERQPEVTGRLELFGHQDGRAIALTADRAVFVDVDPTRLTLVAVDDAGLTPLDTLVSPNQEGIYRARRFADDRVGLVGFFGQSLGIYDTTGDVLVERGRVPGTCNDAAQSGDRLYCCDGLDPVVRVFDVSDPDNPALVGPAATGRCTFIEADGDAVATSTGDAVVSWTATGFNLTERARIDRPGSFIVPFLGLDAGRIYLSDAEGATLHDLDLNEQHVFEGLTSGVLRGDRLVRERGVGGVEVWDLSGPTPFLSHSLSAVAGDVNVDATGQYAAARGAGAWVLLDLDDPEDPNRTHPRHGGATHAFSTGVQLYALSRSAYRTLDVSDPAAPLVDLGGLRLLNAFASAVSLGGTFGAPVVPVSTPTNPYLGFSGYVVVDASDPEAPVLTHNLNFAALSWVSDGRRLYAAESGRANNEDFHDLFVYDALEQPATGLPVLAVAQTFPLGTSTGFNHPGARTIAAVDGASGRLALTTFNGGAGLALELINISDLNALGRVGLRILDTPQLSDIAVAGDNVLGVENPSLSNYGGTRLSLFRPVNNRLDEVAGIDLGGIGDILVFDGRTAILGTQSGLRFVDFSQGQPVDLGSLTTEPRPISAALHADHLVIASGDTVELISPPCPPPN